MKWVPVPPLLTIAHGDAVSPQQVSGVHQQLHAGFGQGAALLRVGDEDRVALIAHHPLEAQAGGRDDLPRQGERRLARLHAAPRHADVHLDHDAQPHALRLRRRVELGHVGRVVHRDHDLGVAGQVDQPRDLARADDLVGDQDVLDAGRRPAPRPRPAWRR